MGVSVGVRASRKTDPTSVVVDEVRELIRRHNLDPGHHTDAVHQLVDEVLADYDDRATRTALPPLADPARVRQHVLDHVAGYGVLQQYFDDPEVEEIWINDPGKVFIARRGVSELTTTLLTAEQVRDLVERMLKHSGRRLDVSQPFVDAALPDGSRLHVVIPDVTRQHWAVNIRKFVVRAAHLDEVVSLGTCTPLAAQFLRAAVAAGVNLLISGGTQAGKTTLLNSCIAAIGPRERVVTCEEVFELDVLARDVVSLQCRQPSLEGTGEITLRQLIKEALRMRPSRLVVGEVRQAESLDLLIALNSGLPGMCTIHANSAREAIMKLCTLPLLAGANISSQFVVPTVAASIDIVVHLALADDGTRRIQQIVGVPGLVENGMVATEELFALREGRLVRLPGYPPHPERFTRVGYDLQSGFAEPALDVH